MKPRNTKPTEIVELCNSQTAKLWKLCFFLLYIVKLSTSQKNETNQMVAVTFGSLKDVVRYGIKRTNHLTVRRLYMANVEGTSVFTIQPTTSPIVHRFHLFSMWVVSLTSFCLFCLFLWLIIRECTMLFFLLKMKYTLVDIVSVIDIRILSLHKKY